MENGPPTQSHCSLSLKRLLDADPNYPSKKRKKPISLSKSRNRSNPSSQQLLLDIKPEPLSQQPPLNAFKPEPLSQQPPLDTIKPEDCTIKDEKIKLEEYDYLEKPKLECKNEPLLCDIIKEEDIIPPEIDTSTYNSPPQSSSSTSKENNLEEYACPICNESLTSVKSSYLRQQHVERCIYIESIPKLDQELEFNDCVFCGKNLTHFKSNSRQVHINRCLDAADELEKQHQESMFAGQHVPFLSTLELCPVCHEFDPFQNRMLKQKIVHIKQCARRNQLSIPQLLKKLQWIGWGHTPVPTTTTTTPVENTPPPLPLKIPQHQLAAYIIPDIHEEHDDFSNQVIIHASRVPEGNQRREDKLDDELQTALAISKSLQQSKRKQRITKLDERDWNAANIWSSEDSKTNAMTRLDDIMFSQTPADDYRQAQREASNGQLGPSRIIPTHAPFFWDLTNNRQSNWHDPLIFTSLFIRRLKNV
ncbi:hypothetical protein FB192DRAFT_1390531 [Mucor lusitanicus]|uniref:UBZ4-type domain-containing protein n=2 Tax=Mucor circinelloides f. lusitanicus TaxID=29924 RepID=A0A162ZMW3_MUCCL|nr:hypothetical protein FB192DRAFT_1390531 [Mucor lusitanicus]OAD06597.1 hypothetical protein MUCCIDRAFT_107173 [Mucor lusitanicus CBS 277.49]